MRSGARGEVIRVYGSRFSIEAPPRNRPTNAIVTALASPATSRLQWRPEQSGQTEMLHSHRARRRRGRPGDRRQHGLSWAKRDALFLIADASAALGDASCARTCRYDAWQIARQLELSARG